MAKAKIPKSPDLDRRSAVNNLLRSLRNDICCSTARISEQEQRIATKKFSLRLKEVSGRLEQRREQMKLKGGAA